MENLKVGSLVIWGGDVWEIVSDEEFLNNYKKHWPNYYYEAFYQCRQLKTNKYNGLPRKAVKPL